MDVTAVPAVYAGPLSYCLIHEDGAARWFSTGEAAGKTMTVTVPENGGFCVYNADMTLAASCLDLRRHHRHPAGGRVDGLCR